MSEMNLGKTERLEPLLEAVRTMINEEVLPLEEEYLAEVAKDDRWTYTARQTEILEWLKKKARDRGLWNFWLTASDRGYGLTTVEYAYLAEEMGKAHLGAEVFNCSAPDTGNMEVLERFANEAQKKQWLEPLLDGKIRSAYLMTEPDVASSDATNISMRCVRDGDHYVLNGEKWWSSGAGDPRCAIYITMVKTGRRRRSQAQASFHDPRAGRYARHQKTESDGSLRARRCPARPSPHPFHRTCGCRSRTWCSAKVEVSKSPRAVLDRAASTTVCGRSARPNARWS